MLEIRITVSAPELARAINNLASALNGAKIAEQVTGTITEVIKSANYVEEPVVNTPNYTTEQIMQAGAALMDAGKIDELTKLLQSFGVQAVMQLKPEQFDAFAAALRNLGAKI